MLIGHASVYTEMERSSIRHPQPVSQEYSIMHLSPNDHENENLGSVSRGLLHRRQIHLCYNSTKIHSKQQVVTKQTQIVV